MNQDWNIQVVFDKMKKEVADCNTQIEIDLCEAKYEYDIVRLAESQARNGRLSPLSLAIVRALDPDFGIKK